MERHQIIDAMTTLKLFGMRASFDEIVGKGLRRRDELYPLLASLINAEIAHRQSRSINYRIGGARFPVLKDLDSFVFADTPVDEGQIRELATGAFLDAKRNLILIGGTGTGKTHLAIAVASAVIRTRARGRFFNLVDLVNQLEARRPPGAAAGSPKPSSVMTSSSSTSSATCPSARPADSSSSTSSASSTRTPRSSSPPTSPSPTGPRSSATPR